MASFEDWTLSNSLFAIQTWDSKGLYAKTMFEERTLTRSVRTASPEQALLDFPPDSMDLLNEFHFSSPQPITDGRHTRFQQAAWFWSSPVQAMSSMLTQHAEWHGGQFGYLTPRSTLILQNDFSSIADYSKRFAIIFGVSLPTTKKHQEAFVRNENRTAGNRKQRPHTNSSDSAVFEINYTRS